MAIFRFMLYFMLLCQSGLSFTVMITIKWEVIFICCSVLQNASYNLILCMPWRLGESEQENYYFKQNVNQRSEKNEESAPKGGWWTTHTISVFYTQSPVPILRTHRGANKTHWTKSPFCSNPSMAPHCPLDTLTRFPDPLHSGCLLVFLYLGRGSNVLGSSHH